MANILIVDDERSIRHALEKFLKSFDHQVFTAADGQEALNLLETNPIDLALVDLVMPKLDGLKLIRRMQVISPDTVAIVLTGFGTITSAVEAMKAGAYHYLTKPFELEDITSILQTALSHRQLKRENLALKRQLQEKYRFENIIGKSNPMQSVYSLIEKVSQTDSTVLI
ncbi:MAG: sigma-54-dependent Fis family transcriptional regulator, partial [Deltaproteobacteria bacterium]|nr:sigma-54-dependent Fis family transcriptional regulator [Deltaproteobacteria bacterium]